MSASAHSDSPLIVIGENIHTTRVVLRRSKRFHEDNGFEAIRYQTVDGEERLLPVPDTMKNTQDYAEGRMKHVAIAVNTAMGKTDTDPEEGMLYLRRLVHDQEQACADFLDVNVDEIAIKDEERLAAMQWLARTVEAMTDLPLAIDSSSIEVIEAGLDVLDRHGGRPMLNSASLERLDALDIARKWDTQVVVTAAGEAGMPDGTAQRVENASRMVDAAQDKGIALSDIYIDPLIFPISVDQESGNHCLDAIRALREKYGPEIHITGGMSNVSFGIPARLIINDVFLLLVMDAGADSGIIDPVLTPPAKLRQVDRETQAYKLAEDLLLGRDKDCRTFIRAWRKKTLGSLHGQP